MNPSLPWPYIFFLMVVATKSSSPCPFGMSLINASQGLSPYCIDIFEATIEAQLPGENETWTLNAYNMNLDSLDVSGTPYRAAIPKPWVQQSLFTTERTEKPQAYISQVQARRACGTASKRLCSLAEYRTACGGMAANATYPYGNTYQPGWCNTGHPNPVTIIFGPTAKFNSVEMNNPVLVTLEDTVAYSAGKYAKCTQPSPDTATLDQAGSLDEWVDDVTMSGHGVFAGGYFVDDAINGPGCLYRTIAHVPTYHDYSLGFRCCKDM